MISKLKKNIKSIYIYDNGVRNSLKGGTGSGDITSHYFGTTEQTFIKNRIQNLTKNYLGEYDKAYLDAKIEFFACFKTQVILLIYLVLKKLKKL